MSGNYIKTIENEAWLQKWGTMLLSLLVHFGCFILVALVLHSKADKDKT